jgi:flagellar motor switch protein FliM
MSFSIAATESNPQLVQIVPPNEVVVVIGFELKMSNRAGTMNLCIPYNVMEPVIEELSAQSWFSAAKNQRSKTVEEQIGRGLQRATVGVTAMLAHATITLRDLMEMSIGDLISTDKPASQPVVLCVEGEKKYLAQIGQFKGKRALRIVRGYRPTDRVM